MNLRNEVLNIIYILDNNRQFKKNIQGTLRDYVTDKTYPLEDRFEVWSKYCEKDHKTWIVSEDQFGYVGKHVNKYKRENVFYQRYKKYTYLDYLDMYCDEEDNGSGVKSFEDLQENLIETNFGYFILDW